MSNPLLRYVLPTLLIGSLGGYFVGSTFARSGQKTQGKVSAQGSTLRSDFLSSDDDEVDYEKLARVCITAAGPRSNFKRGQLGHPSGAR